MCVKASEVYSVQELADALGICKKSVYRNILGKGCPRYKVGNKIQISGASYQKWVEINSRGSDDDPDEEGPDGQDDSGDSSV